MAHPSERPPAPPTHRFPDQPARYRHWKLAFEGDTAQLIMDVDEAAGLFRLPAQAQLLRPRRRHRARRRRPAPQVRAPAGEVVVLRSGKDRVFCAGANIRMLAGSSHAHKVNFCKFTNETRNAMEDASALGQQYICAIRGTAAGGGYELALAPTTSCSPTTATHRSRFPSCRCLRCCRAPGGSPAGDKRKVRRDLADAFSTLEEGIRGQRAVEWRLVDEAVPNSFDQAWRLPAGSLPSRTARGGPGRGASAARAHLLRRPRIYSTSRSRSTAARGARSSDSGSVERRRLRSPGPSRSRATVLALAAGPGAGRRHPPPPAERARHRRPPLQVPGRPRAGPGLLALLDAGAGRWLVREILLTGSGS